MGDNEINDILANSSLLTDVGQGQYMRGEDVLLVEENGRCYFCDKDGWPFASVGAGDLPYMIGKVDGHQMLLWLKEYADVAGYDVREL
jgi:hypothetical protein